MAEKTNSGSKSSSNTGTNYDVVLRAKIIDRWEALETGKAEPTISSVKTDRKSVV